MVLNEILNADHRDLSERIDKHPESVSIVGVCGESPAHIAIYKRDTKMLKMLLDAGTSPNIVNQAGDSLVHVTARLGFFECLQLLYETKRCELILKNKLNQTALDIAQSDVQKHALHALKLFADYHFDEPSEVDQLQAIIDGRAKCAIYLSEKMLIDRENKVKNMVKETLDATRERRNKARIMRGMGGTKFTSFYTDLTYDTNINKPPWEKIDMTFFVGYAAGLDTVVRTVFACDFVHNSIRTGMHNVLVEIKSKLPVFTYPVPTYEARIPMTGNAHTKTASNNLSVLNRNNESRTNTAAFAPPTGLTTGSSVTTNVGTAEILPLGTTRTRILPHIRNTEQNEAPLVNQPTSSESLIDVAKNDIIVGTRPLSGSGSNRTPLLAPLVAQQGSIKPPNLLSMNSNRRNLLSNRLNSSSQKQNPTEDGSS